MEEARDSKIDLTFVSTADMIAEMQKRHDGLCIAGIKFTTAHHFTCTKHWGGNHFVCLGILQDLIHQINKKGDASFNQTVS